MAREFDRSSSQYLVGVGTLMGGYPKSMACWFQATDITTEHTLMDITLSSSGNNYYVMRAAGTRVGDPVTLYRNDTTPHALDTTAGYTINTWHHACAVIAAANDVSVYLDGGNKATSNVAIDPAIIDRVDIGRSGDSTPGSYLDGLAAEAAMWTVALTDAEVAMLATGIRPIMVHPQSLARYWPLVRDQDYDLINGYSLTPNGGPTIAAHPPVIYGATLGLFGVAGAGPTNLYPGLSGLSGLTGLTPIMGVA